MKNDREMTHDEWVKHVNFGVLYVKQPTPQNKPIKNKNFFLVIKNIIRFFVDVISLLIILIVLYKREIIEIGGSYGLLILWCILSYYVLVLFSNI